MAKNWNVDQCLYDFNGLELAFKTGRIIRILLGTKTCQSESGAIMESIQSHW